MVCHILLICKAYESDSLGLHSLIRMCWHESAMAQLLLDEIND